MNQVTDKKMQYPQWLFWVLLITLGLAAVWFMRYLTPDGMGLVNDSVGYIGGARNIAAGNGYSRLKGNGVPTPITNYPPFFSIVLAGISFLGPDPIEGSLILNVLLFGANVFMMGFLVRKATGNGLWGLAAAVFFGASEPLLRTHSFAMTEPLYLFLSFLVLWFYLKFSEKENWLWLAASGFTASLAFLTRYVGVSLYGTVVLCLFLFSSKEKGIFINWRRFWKGTGIFLAAGIPLVLAWLARNFLVSQNAGNRLLLWHPVTRDMLNEGMQNFWSWLLPETGGLIDRYLNILTVLFFVLLAVLVTGTVIAFVLYKRERIQVVEDRFRAGWVFALQGWVYLATLVFSMTFLDASPIFEDRILAPFYIPLLAIFAMILSWLWGRKKLVWMAGAVVISLGLLLSFAEDDVDAIAEFRQDGQGFAHSNWTDSEVIAAVKDLDNVTLFSNKITAIYILTGKPAYVVPSPTNPATRLPREGYEEDMASIHESVLAGKSVIAIFNFRALENDPEEAQWMKDISNGMPVLKELQDGVIFGISPKN